MDAKILHRGARRFALAATCLMAIAARSGVATADPLESTQSQRLLEEIVVTAQKREQAILDVSIPITAFTGEQLKTFGFEHADEVARFTPGVNFVESSGGRQGSFAIRGVVQSDFSDLTELPNSLYVDDAYFSNVQAQRFGLFDLERVEILRGPQGTLFGRNATGGLIHFITRKPTEEFEAYGDVQYGSYEQRRLEGAASGPLTTNVSGRLSAMYNRHDGIQDNLYPDIQTIDPTDGQPYIGSVSGAEDLGDDEMWAARAQLLWTASETVELLMIGFASQSDTGPMSTFPPNLTAVLEPGTGRHLNTILAANDPQGCEAISSVDGSCLPIDFLDGDVGDLTRPVPGGDLAGFRDPGGRDNLDAAQDYAPDWDKSDIYGTTAKLTWDSEAFALTAVSHYVHYEKQKTLDADTSPTPVVNTTQTNKTDSFTQELRLNGQLARAEWIAGAYYLHIDNEHPQGLGYFPDSPVATFFSGGVPFEVVSYPHLKTDSYSLFGQIDYHLTDRLTVIAGLRAVVEDKEFDYRNEFYVNNDEIRFDFDSPIPAVALLGFPAEYPPFSADTSNTLWAGRLALEYRPNEDWLLFAGVNRGVKAGSFNGKVNDFTPPLPPENIPYKEEVLTAYETGFKSALAGGAASLNGSVYFYDYDDYQAFVFSGVGGFIRNTDGEYMGAELQLAMKPLDNLELILSTSWLDAEIKDLEVAQGVFRDVAPVFSPEWQVGGLARYTWGNVLFGGDVATQVDFTYMGDRWGNLRNFDAHKLDAYTVRNARVHWTSADDGWTATLFVNNLTDERYGTSFFDLSTFTGNGQMTLGAPRWYGARLSYAW